MIDSTLILFFPLGAGERHWPGLALFEAPLSPQLHAEHSTPRSVWHVRLSMRYNSWLTIVFLFSRVRTWIHSIILHHSCQAVHTARPPHIYSFWLDHEQPPSCILCIPLFCVNLSFLRPRVHYLFALLSSVSLRPSLSPVLFLERWWNPPLPPASWPTLRPVYSKIESLAQDFRSRGATEQRRRAPWEAVSTGFVKQVYTDEN